jgi:hypothetical protein
VNANSVCGITACAVLSGFLLSQSAIADDNTGAQGTGQTINLIDQPASQASLFSFNYGIPASPSLALAGLADANITPSTSLKPFILSLPGLFGAGGDGQSTVAAEISPAWALGEDRSISTRDYREDGWWQRVGLRTHIGITLYKGQSAGSDPTQQKDSRVALAFSTSLADASDPLAVSPGTNLNAWDNCKQQNADKLTNANFSNDQRKVLVAYQTVDADATPFSGEQPVYDPQHLKHLEETLTTVAHIDVAGRERVSDQKQRYLLDKKDYDNFIAGIVDQLKPLDQATADALEDCRKHASDAAQQGADLQVGAGIVWSGDPGAWANFGDPNAAFWTSGRYPLDDLFNSQRKPTDCGDNDPRSGAALIFSCWMVGGSGRYSAGEMVSTGDSTTPEFKANVLEGWLGLERIDSKSKFGGYFGYLQQHATDSAQDQFSKGGTRWLVSAAYNLGDIGVSFFPQGTWIEGSYGSANGSVTTLDDKVAMLTVSFGPPKIGSGFVTTSGSSGSPAGAGSGTTGTSPPANGGVTP